MKIHLGLVLIFWIYTVEPTACKLVMGDTAPVPLVTGSIYLRNLLENTFLKKVFRSRSLEKESLKFLLGIGCFHERYYLNPLKPNETYRGRTAPLTSKRCILYIYSTNIGTEYFKHGIYSQFFSLQNAVCFIILTYLIPALFKFYIQGVLKLKKNNSGAKRLK